MNGDNQPEKHEQPIEEPKQLRELSERDCPFCDKACEDCRLYEEITMMNPSMPGPQKVRMCIFKAILMVLGTPRPQPQIMKMPMPPGMIPPGLNPLRQ